MNLPARFIETVSPLLPADERERFFAALDREASCSIRLNPFKHGVVPDDARPVAWCGDGYVLEKRPSFTLDPRFHGGDYYVQEAGSMFVGYLAEQFLDIDGRQPVAVLDLCAAPGGKSTHLSSIIGDKGTLVANEIHNGRVMLLADNIRKWGLANTIVTSSEPSAFGSLGGTFDLMLIDAPCSGEGMFRKEPAALEQWSLENVNMCADRSRHIISDAWDTLKEGGILIFSTCTYNRTENEDTVEWMIRNFETSPVDVALPDGCGIRVTEASCDGVTHKCYRFMPHLTDGEGLFVTVLRKSGGGVVASGGGYKKSPLVACPKGEEALLRRHMVGDERFDFFKFKDDSYACFTHSRRLLESAASRLRVIYSPLFMGQVIRDELKPSHPLALTPYLDTTRFATTDLPLDAALDYLRRGVVDASLYAEGLSLVQYGDTPIGFAKRIGRRVNNLLPVNQRIVNL